jgi:hypothetical protein
MLCHVTSIRPTEVIKLRLERKPALRSAQRTQNANKPAVSTHRDVATQRRQRAGERTLFDRAAGELRTQYRNGTYN